MIDTYLSILTSVWWVFGYVVTAGIMIGLHQPDKDATFVARFIGATIMFIVAYFVYPVFLGMFLTRFIKS